MWRFRNRWPPGIFPHFFFFPFQLSFVRHMCDNFVTEGYPGISPFILTCFFSKYFFPFSFARLTTHVAGLQQVWQVCNRCGGFATGSRLVIVFPFWIAVPPVAEMQISLAY